MLGARVVAVLGSLSVAVGVTGGVYPAEVRAHRAINPMCMPRRFAFGGALRAAKTHPITSSTLGARDVDRGHPVALVRIDDASHGPRGLCVFEFIQAVVAVLGPLVRWWPLRGVASSGKRELNHSLCVSRPPSVLV